MRLKCYKIRTFQPKTYHWQLYRQTAAKKFTSDSLECPPAMYYLVGSIMENSEPLPGSETTLI